jgi:hypothetical protein
MRWTANVKRGIILFLIFFRFSIFLFFYFSAPESAKKVFAWQHLALKRKFLHCSTSDFRAEIMLTVLLAIF